MPRHMIILSLPSMQKLRLTADVKLYILQSSMNNSDAHNLSQNAIKAAVSKNWQEAVDLNEAILETSPKDFSALNRLGIAYSMIGKKTKSIASFRQVLALDPKNQIARNNLNRLKVLKDSKMIGSQVNRVNFVEEPGKSKVVSLVSAGEPAFLSTLSIGEQIEIVPGKFKIKITNAKKKFIGYLPDIISHRLLQLIKGGYKYRGFIKSINPKSPSIYIEETHTSKRLKGLRSFPLDENEILPNLTAGESSEIPPLEIY